LIILSHIYHIGVDLDKKKFISSIFFWDVMEQDIMPFHATVPLMPRLASL